MNFPNRLRELREEKGLSQKALADEIGMTIRQISRFETAAQKPSWDTVQALAAALGVDCTAFQQEPATRPPQGRGRPAKAAGEKPAKRKRGKK